MMPMSEGTIRDALLIVRSGRDVGISLSEFAGRWPQLTGKPRRTLRGVGQVMGALVRSGLVERSSPGRRARFSLTSSGAQFLDSRRKRS
jgi:hypothetical protein